jgi:uncharacterized membrane protein YfhO
MIALVLLEVLQRWKEILHPKRELAWLLFMIIVSLLIGLAPGVDNFAHIGGFIMGFFAGLAVFPTRGLTRWWVGGRIIGIIAVLVLNVLMLVQFYSGTGGTQLCSWCKYLSCLPITGNSCAAYNEQIF